MKNSGTTGRPERRDRLIREHINNPYKLRGDLPEPTRCPQCGAIFAHGRWTWNKAPVEPVGDALCEACRRVNDRYPAGEVLLQGDFVAAHRDEILGLARNLERRENAEHPLNRIMGIEDRPEGLLVTTTDIHLPHAIGHALENAWEGDLQMHYDDQGCFARVVWRRDG